VWGIKLQNPKNYFNLLRQEWSLSATDLESASGLTRFFRNYIGPIRFVTISFIIVLISFSYQCYHFYHLLQATHDAASLLHKFAVFGWTVLGLIFFLFAMAMGNVFIMSTLIFKSADMIDEALEFRCVKPSNNFRVQCVFSRLNFMISSIEQNRIMIKAFQNDLLEKNSILDQSEKKFRHVINTSPDAILVMDKQWNFIQSNHTAEKMFGYTDEELHTLTPYNLASTSMNNNFVQDVMEQESNEFEFTCTRKDGSNFDVQIRLKKLEERKKDNSYMLAIITDITERKTNIRRLKESLDEKEILLREIHHRVKNNMQIISSMIGVQAISSTNKEVKELLASSQSRILAMMLIHEKLYNTSDIAAIDFAKYTYELMQRLFDTNTAEENQHITYAVNIKQLILDIDTALYCGLIINELVSNAFKYAFVGLKKGIITISIAHNPDKSVTLQVTDDGVGMDHDIDISKIKSLGLRLVYKLANFQLKGQFTFISTPTGTSFEITFIPKEAIK
jgi:PAS domain S-box-containing protein